jgi:hypothetical protein
MLRKTKAAATLTYLAALLGLATLTGCHSAFVETTIDNRGPAPVRLVEVDYPSASFGVGSLNANAKYHYHFKIQGSGPVKIEFTDAAGKLHSSQGPVLTQGQEGNLTIAIDPAGQVEWHSALSTIQ